MQIWKLIWQVVMILGLAGFVFIGLAVIVKGFGEIRELLKNLAREDAGRS